MKKLRKLLSVAVAALAAASLAVTTTVTSFAEDEAATVTHDLIIEGTTKGHIYEAYQIFSGTLDKESGGTLSNIQWGSSIDDDGVALLDALKEYSSDNFNECKTAADVAEVIGKKYTAAEDIAALVQVIDQYLGTATKSVTSTETTTTIPGLSNGYYLIKDKNDTLDGEYDAHTAFITKIVGITNAKLKTGVPTLDKTVMDDDDDADSGKTWQDVADYDIGEAVPFKLTATMPDNIDAYKTYKLIFNDTMSEGLTYDKVTSITVDGEEITLPNEGIQIVDRDQTLTVTITDLKSLGKSITKNTVVEVFFSAKLNGKAVIGRPGNPNTADLEYSNNPNHDGDGDMGKTPEAKVVVFTYELDVKKVDGETKTEVLKDAEFKLSNEDGSKWLKIDESGELSWVESENDATVLKTGEDGYIKIKGLDEGKYKLKETKAPHGYNLLPNAIDLEIKANDVHNVPYDGKNADAELLGLTLKVDIGDPTESGDENKGIVSTNVENNKGSVLPETGGIGTTIFFVGGGIVVAGAAILLIVKRRMRSDS